MPLQTTRIPLSFPMVPDVYVLPPPQGKELYSFFLTPYRDIFGSALTTTLNLCLPLYYYAKVI